MTFVQRRYSSGQQAHEKMLDIINHWGNSNQKHNRISFDIQWGDYNKKMDNKKCW